MADYKEMYLKLFRATTEAIAILQRVQQETEDLYISEEEPKLVVFPLPEEENKKQDLQ